MAIVMGLDQHRAQITTEWIDTVTGEVSRGRVTPADRQGVIRFLERFAGLLTGENRAWLEQLPLTGAARGQITVALAMIDAVEVLLAPPDRVQGDSGALRDRCADERRDPRRARRRATLAYRRLPSSTIRSRPGNQPPRTLPTLNVEEPYGTAI